MLLPADLILYAIILAYKKKEMLFNTYLLVTLNFMPFAKPLVSGCWGIFKCIFQILGFFFD